MINNTFFNIVYRVGIYIVYTVDKKETRIVRITEYEGFDHCQSPDTLKEFSGQVLKK